MALKQEQKQMPAQIDLFVKCKHTFVFQNKQTFQN